MDRPASDFVPALERLTSKLEELEQRISTLEKRAAGLPAVDSSVRPSTVDAKHAKAAFSSSSASLISTLGKSILGVAGAYLLRAAAELEVFPRLAVVITALLYAWLWQYLSVRAGKNSRATEAAYGITSALILFPMLWEITAGFKILTPNWTAGVLVVFLISVLILGRSGEAPATVWVTAVFSSCTALGLLVATRDPLPFGLALVSIAALVELASSQVRMPGLRIAIGIPLNLALLTLLYLASRPEGFPPEYIAIPRLTVLALFAVSASICLAGTFTRTLRMQAGVSFLDVGQSAVTFGLLWVAILYLGVPAEAKLLGVCCLVLAAAFYFGALFIHRIRTSSHKFHTYSIWAGALFLIGSALAIPQSTLSPWLSLSAVIATGLGVRFKLLTFGFHGFCFLIGAQISSGLARNAILLLAGNVPSALPSVIWWAAIGLGACCLLLALRGVEVRGIGILRVCYFANVSLLLSAFSVFAAVLILQPGIAVGLSGLSLVRSIVICVVTLLMAVLSARSKLKELMWVAYATIGLGTLKLIFEDLRLGSTGSFALSLLAFGVVLALVPRIVRPTKQEADG
jgi:hypothetical protein